MSTTPHDLISALSNADMLEIDDLHAWQFSLDAEQLAQRARKDGLRVLVIQAATEGEDMANQWAKAYERSHAL